MCRALWLAREEGIIVAYRDLPSGYLGVYDWEQGETPLIILDTRLQFGLRAVLRSVLYEELGHHYTLRPMGLHQRYGTFAMRLHRSIQEAKALRWAAQHVLQPSDWQAAHAASDRSIPVLAELWDVTEELAETIVTTHWQPKMICHCPLCRLGEQETTETAGG